LSGSESVADQATHELSLVQLFFHLKLAIVIFLEVDFVAGDVLEGMRTVLLLVEVVLEPRHLRV